MTADPYNVLFPCTGNSARSIFGEVLVNALGEGRLRGFSAGSRPKGAVHPMALQSLDEPHFPSDRLRSKSGDEFAADGGRPWTSCSPSATAPPRRPVPSGPASP